MDEKEEHRKRETGPDDKRRAGMQKCLVLFEDRPELGKVGIADQPNKSEAAELKEGDGEEKLPQCEEIRQHIRPKGVAEDEPAGGTEDDARLDVARSSVLQPKNAQLAKGKGDIADRRRENKGFRPGPKEYEKDEADEENRHRNPDANRRSQKVRYRPCRRLLGQKNQGSETAGSAKGGKGHANTVARAPPDPTQEIAPDSIDSQPVPRLHAAESSITKGLRVRRMRRPDQADQAGRDEGEGDGVEDPGAIHELRRIDAAPVEPELQEGRRGQRKQGQEGPRAEDRLK